MGVLGKVKNKFSTSPMLKNITKISSGTLLGQLVSLVTLPIFTRIYGATVIGYWTLFTSVAFIVNSFSDLGMTQAIMVEDDEKKRKELFSVITTLCLVLSIIVGAIFFVYYTVVPSNSGISPLFYAVVLTVLIFTQQQTQLCYTWLNKNGQYNILMKNPIVNSVAIAVVAIPLGLIGTFCNISLLITYGYYVALICGQLLTLIHMRRFIPKTNLDFNIKHYIEKIKMYQEFVKYQTPTMILAQIKNQAPVILIRMFFGTEILGYYSVTNRVLSIPINLLAHSIGRVYYQNAAEKASKGENIGEFTFRNITKAMRIAIVPMILMMSFGDVVSTIAFGSGYVVTGNMLRIFTLMTFFTFLMQATQGVSIVIHKQKYNMILAIAQVLGYVIGLLIGKYCFNSIYVACMFMTLIFSLAQVIYFSAIFKVTDVGVSRYLRNVGASVGILLVAVAIIRIILLLLFSVPII